MTELFNKIVSDRETRGDTLPKIRHALCQFAGGKNSEQLYDLLSQPPFRGIEDDVNFRGSNSQFSDSFLDILTHDTLSVRTDAILAHLQLLSPEEFYPGARQDLGLDIL